MNFLISGAHISPVYLMGVGFVVGILGGFFGVGGSFLAGPALYAAGVPMNFVVGTDLTHIVGKSIVAARKHRTLGNIDFKLGAIMVVGTIAGVETGAQVIQWLKGAARIDWIVGPTFIVILLGITGFMTLEAIQTHRSRRAAPRAKGGAHPSRSDHSAMAFIAHAVHRISLPPHVRLSVSGIASLSVWAILAVAFIG